MESEFGLGLGRLPKPLIYIAAGLLFLGAFPLPYGYYMLLRVIGRETRVEGEGYHRQ